MKQGERLKVLENFFWRLNLHRSLTMREDKVLEMLKMSDMWVNAHSDNNGERSSADIKKNIDAAYEALKLLP